MITIVQNNSISRVIGLEPDQLKTLRYKVAYFNSSMWVRTKNKYKALTPLIDVHGQFATGLVKRTVRELWSMGIMANVVDNRIVPSYKKLRLVDRLKSFEPPLYPEQDVGASAIAKSECGILEMPTGIGKSRVIKEALVRTQRPSLIITPSSNLRSQTYSYLSESFGTDDVGLLKTGHNKPIIVTNYHAIKSKDAGYFKQFAQLYFDEFHNAAAEGVRDDFKDKLTEIYYRYGLTATNFRNDDGASIYLESILSETLYSVSTIEAINKGYIRPLVSFFKDLKNNHAFATGNYRADVSKFIDTNPERNEYAIETARKMINNHIPTIILVDHVEHGRYLKDALGGEGLFLNGQDESAEYNMDMVKRFNNLEIPYLVGTSVLGEGVDTKACGAMINCSGGKARSELQQKCGRPIRNFKNKSVAYYFDFIDNKQKHIKAHSNIRMKTVQEVYGKPINIVT